VKESTVPKNLVIVRHGESEGNIVNSRHWSDTDPPIPEEHFKRHNSKFRLTDKGIWQAKKTGKWLKEEFPEKFDLYYVSEFIRAIETGVNLDLPEAIWRLESTLRERDWGELDNIHPKIRDRKYSKFMEDRELDGYYAKPPGGETLEHKKFLIKTGILETLCRRIPNGSAILVCHGEVMWMFRVLFERMTQLQYYKLDQSESEHDRIHNCQVLQYTRVNPHDSEDVRDRFEWMRSVCPWDLSKSPNMWTQIVRPRLTNDDLRKIVEDYPRIISQ